MEQMHAIVSKEWKKEDELKGLKSELATLDRKIQLELALPTSETEEKTVDVQKDTSEKKSTSEQEIRLGKEGIERQRGIRI